MENTSKLIQEALSSNYVTSYYKSTKNTKKSYYATFPDGSRFKSTGYKSRITWLRKSDLENAISNMAYTIYNSSSESIRTSITLEDFTNEILSSMTIHELTE